VPLVSGVCRTASAPRLSHGGSRLNASKPEANPKTRCPTTTTTVFNLFILESTCLAAEIAEGGSSIWFFKNKNTRYRIAIYNKVGCAHLVGAKYLQDHKNLPIRKTRTTEKAFSYSKRLVPKFILKNQKQNTITSLSKRENMHGLA